MKDIKTQAIEMLCDHLDPEVLTHLWNCLDELKEDKRNKIIEEIIDDKESHIFIDERYSPETIDYLQAKLLQAIQHNCGLKDWALNYMPYYDRDKFIGMVKG